MTRIPSRGEILGRTDEPIIGWLDVIAKAAALGLITDPDPDTQRRAPLAPHERTR